MEEVLSAEGRLSTAGLETTGVADTTCCFAEKTETWISDPDGARWEWYVRSGDAEQLQGTTLRSRPRSGGNGRLLLDVLLLSCRQGKSDGFFGGSHLWEGRTTRGARVNRPTNGCRYREKKLPYRIRVSVGDLVHQGVEKIAKLTGNVDDRR